MRWVRAGANAMAWFLRSEPLPAAGELFRYFYLTHVSAEDPAIMAAT